MKKILVLSALAGALLNAEVLVYGPGGPAPVMRELAAKFEEKSGEKVIVTAGPTSDWIGKARANADVIFSGNASMMDSFLKEFSSLKRENIQLLGIRPAGVVVRPNNPKNITKFEDILQDGINVMVVDGAGQVALYEDMALKDGKRENLIKLRKNIKFYAKNSKVAIEEWKSNSSLDALIIWSHWAKVLGESAQFVEAGKESVIYRSAEIAPTQKGLKNQKALEFIEFVQSDEAKKVWQKHAWK